MPDQLTDKHTGFPTKLVDMGDTTYAERGADSPAEYAAPAVADADFSQPSRALYVGGGGNVSVVMKGGGTVVFFNVQAGTLLPLRATRITAATTATNIVAVW